VSTLLVLWDGEQLIDADAGYAATRTSPPNCSLPPTRHVPPRRAARS